jgi:adenine phosphoribosyltransferase
MSEKIKSKIRTVKDWPKKGVMFRDFTSLTQDSEGFRELIDLLFERYKNMKIDAIVGIDSRGFITGSVLAYKLSLGFIPIRKKGKLPPPCISQEYELEYGTDTIEIHKDSIKPGMNVIVFDDLVATGGTLLAACDLIKKCGGNVIECSLVIDLPDIGGRKKVEDAGYKVHTIVEFEGD